MSQLDLSFSQLMGAVGESNLRLVDFHPDSLLQTPQSEVPRALVPAIDFHNHVDELNPNDVLRVMDSCNIERLLNITTRTGDAGMESLRRFHHASRERFATCMWMDWSDLHTPGFFERTLERMERFAEAGACGIKLWKDLGLERRAPDGRLLTIDDPRLDAVYAKAEELGIFVMFHTADPDAFFLPIDRRNERYEELIAHPDWSFEASPVPKSALLEQRNRVFARHPNTRFLCAHLAEQGENLHAVMRMLDAHPNVSVDISARVNELGRQPYTARRFFLDYADRILFGADLLPDAAMYSLNFRFLETADEYFLYPSHASRQGRWMIYGLDLPEDVLRRVYRENALAYWR